MNGWGFRSVAVIAAVCCATGNSLRAEIVFTGADILQNFDGLSHINIANIFSADPFQQTAIPGGTGFEAIKLRGASTARPGLIASNGGDLTAGIYSLGATGQNERGLGAYATDDHTMGFGFSLRNASPRTITAITVNFVQEIWRIPSQQSGGMKAEWGTSRLGGMSASSYLFSSALPAVPALNLEVLLRTPNGAVDGNLPANRTAKNFTFGALELRPGDQFFLRWHDLNEIGIDGTVGIDDLRLSVASVPEPGTAVLALGALAAAARGRAKRRQRRYPGLP